MAKRKSTWASEAAMSAVLRYAPQLRALTELQSEAKSTYKTGVAQARGNADASIATIQGAQRQVGGFYDQAGLDQARTASVVNQDIGGLNLSPDLRAAVGLEQANAASRVSTGRAQTQSGLSQQMASARAGGQFASNKAYDDLVQALTKISTQRQGILSDQGTFTASEQARLAREARARAVTIRGQDISAATTQRGQDITVRGQDLSHADRVAARKGTLSATGKKLNPAGAHATAREKVQEGISALRELDPGRTDRHHTAPGLVIGAPAVTGEPVYRTVKTATGQTKQERVLNPDGTPRTTGDLPALPSLGEWATVAADVYYDGHLSRANQRKLADAGYSIRQLGLPTYRQWRKTHPPTRRSTSNYYGGAGAGGGAS